MDSNNVADLDFTSKSKVSFFLQKLYIKFRVFSPNVTDFEALFMVIPVFRAHKLGKIWTQLR